METNSSHFTLDSLASYKVLSSSTLISVYSSLFCSTRWWFCIFESPGWKHISSPAWHSEGIVSRLKSCSSLPWAMVSNTFLHIPRLQSREVSCEICSPLLFSLCRKNKLWVLLAALVSSTLEKRTERGWRTLSSKSNIQKIGVTYIWDHLWAADNGFRESTFMNASRKSSDVSLYQ